MDARTHNKIPKTKFTHLPGHAKIGDLLLVIYPALFRVGREGQDDVLIEKATILIRVQEDSPPVKSEKMDVETGSTRNN